LKVLPGRNCGVGNYLARGANANCARAEEMQSQIIMKSEE
jgi:hypothetical protein